MSGDAIILEARTDTVRVCPRCGTEFELGDRGPGRRPVWCSPRCRRLASAARVAARNAGSAVRVVEVPRAHRPDPDARLPLPSMHTLAQLFLSSDYQCQQLLETLRHRYTRGELSAELRTALEAQATSIGQHQTLAEDPDHQRALREVDRLRDRLQSDVQHAHNRQQELTTLRAELIAKNTLIAQLRTDLTHAQAPTADPRDTNQGSPLSRQQRRAAQRAAHKTQ